ncbi:MAG: sodium:proton antiporter [Thalassobaculales bacterium]
MPRRVRSGTISVLLVGAILAASFPAAAAEGAPHIQAAGLSLIWVLPFAGILLSIALMPLTVPQFWHHHYGKVAAFWALAFVLPCLASFGLSVTLYEVLHTALLEYIPFIILLLALFTVAGGVHLKGDLAGTPGLNTAMLALGTGLASIMGTTGASMLLIRPILRANAHRRSRVHVVVFFIFLVSNIGGSLTPLGDPPLFLGFLKGIDFMWTVKAMAGPMLLCTIALLVIFFILDNYFWLREGRPLAQPTGRPFEIEGHVNFVLLGIILGAVLLSGVWRPDLGITIFHVRVEAQSIVRDLILLACAWMSWLWTAKASREDNGFTWGPILEVAKLFAGIFLTIVPAIAILRAGREGALGGVVALVTDGAGQPVNMMYFWLTGILSSFLDNAPTYLVFFNTAGGDPQVLMTSLHTTLLAISCGAVFMGANTYIGNAPNFMVKAIAEENGVRMPSFFGYMGWSTLFLIPIFFLVTLVYFR